MSVPQKALKSEIFISFFYREFDAVFKEKEMKVESREVRAHYRRKPSATPDLGADGEVRGR